MNLPISPDSFYHIYNHANGKGNLFACEANYVYFLNQYKKYIIPLVNTYSYCLMPNHFHIVVKVKPIPQLKNFFNEKLTSMNQPSKGLEPLEGLVTQIEKLTSRQFSHFFNSYTQSFNKMYRRKGSLFESNFKRKNIEGDDYLRKAIHYIHFNPVVHGFVPTPDKWKFSSYQALISKKPTLIHKTEVISIFGGLDNFIYCHSNPPETTGIN